MPAEARAAPGPSKAKRRGKVFFALLAAKLLAGGAWYMLADGDHVSTDNAYVSADFGAGHAARRRAR